jgi:hypothetical protein
VNAPAKSPADATLDALAEALAPRVARLLQERAADDGDTALAELLASAGYELDREVAP